MIEFNIKKSFRLKPRKVNRKLSLFSNFSNASYPFNFGINSMIYRKTDYFENDEITKFISMWNAISV